MQRVVSLYLPTWSTDRYRRLSGQNAPPVEKPLVMIGRQGSRRLVLALDKAAKAAGIRRGTPVSKAQALVPGLVVEDLDAAADARALQQLAFHFLRIYAPIVAADPPDGLVLDTAGADHLHGNETLMLSGMVNRLHAAGFAARAAIADSWGAAHALARFGRKEISIVSPGGQRAAISGLPMAALRLEERIVSGLKVLGFRTIGELAEAPRAPLTLRFGPEVVRRLTQAFGETGEPIEPVRIAELVEVRRAFPEPIAAAETIARYVQKLVAELCVSLEKRGLGARRVDLVLHRVDSGLQAVRAGTSRPVRDVKQLVRLLTDRIDTIDPGFGIEIMVLTATHAEPLVAAQARSSLLEEGRAEIADTVDVILNRGHRVYRYAAVASDVPERSLASVAALHLRIRSAGLATGRARSGFLQGRNPSKLWRCFRIIRRVISSGKACAIMCGALMGRNGCLANGGNATAKRPPCAIISLSKTKAASVSGFSAPVMANIPRRARRAGSSMGSSHEHAALCRASGDHAFLLPARCKFL